MIRRSKGALEIEGRRIHGQGIEDTTLHRLVVGLTEFMLGVDNVRRDVAASRGQNVRVLEHLAEV